MPGRPGAFPRFGVDEGAVEPSRRFVIAPSLSIPLFDSLRDDEQAELFRIATLRFCDADEVIICGGDPCKGPFVLLEGEVAVEKATIESERLSTLTKGECFGEFSLVGHRPRQRHRNGPWGWRRFSPSKPMWSIDSSTPW